MTIFCESPVGNGLALRSHMILQDVYFNHAFVEDDNGKTSFLDVVIQVIIIILLISSMIYMIRLALELNYGESILTNTFEIMCFVVQVIAYIVFEVNYFKKNAI